MSTSILQSTQALCASSSRHPLLVMDKGLKYVLQCSCMNRGQRCVAQGCASLRIHSSRCQPHKCGLEDGKSSSGFCAAAQVVNKGLKHMLRGEANRLHEYRDELSSFGQYFSEKNNVAGATFIYVVYKMTEHILPEQMVKLEGIYLTAFEKMFALLEDSGWQLQKEPKEGEELELMEEPSYEDLTALGYRT